MKGSARDRVKHLCPPQALEAVRTVRSAWKRLCAYPRVVDCRALGVAVKVRIGNEIELDRVRTYSTKEPETLEWLTRELREDDVFFDVGANVGLYSLYAARLRPGARVYSFEPQVQNFSRLCQNILLNRCDNIVPCCFPISDADTYAIFHVYDMRSGSSLHSLEGLSAQRGNRKHLVQLRQGTMTVSLDSLVRDHGLPAPTLIKLDVDGFEERILAGTRQILRTSGLRSILVEVSQDVGWIGKNWAEQALEKDGFALTGTGDREFIRSGVRSRNCIFTRVKQL